jgi:23S rRNA pseudouridine1911/1915/1917 synthase
MEEKFYSFQIEKGEEGERLDTFLRNRLADLSRSRIKTLIEEGVIKVNGRQVKASYKVKQGELVEVRVPVEKEPVLEPQDVPFRIIYEDEHLAVIEKPAGVVVHPAPGHKEGTLVHGLLKRLKDLSGIGGKLRPGIVHRLDKETSGIMLVAKNDISHRKLVEAFKNREIHKEYFALVYGVPELKAFKVEASIGRHPVNRKKMAVLPSGREAVTLFEVKESFKKASLVLAKPLTGRTHQIRVHLSYKGHPILGDPVYGGLKHNIPKPPRLMLHAWKISFVHPLKEKWVEFTSPIPEDFENYMEKLKGE